MNNAILSRSLRNTKATSIANSLSYPALRTSRAASLNSAIHHGIRRSKGVGFRGKEKPHTQGADQSYGGRDKARSWTDGPSRGSGVTRYGSERKPRSPGGQKASYQDRDSGGFGKEASGNGSVFGGDRSSGKSFGRGITSPFGRSSEKRSLGRPTTRPPRDSDRSAFPRRTSNDQTKGFGDGSRFDQAMDETAEPREQRSSGREKYPSLSSKPTYSSPSYRPNANGRASKPYGSQEKSFKTEQRRPGFDATQTYSGDGKEPKQYASQERSFRSEERRPRFDASKTDRDEDSSTHSRIDNRIPVSIPYTTPASEFLYGTSVVEAALSSRRVPRRKHYKLYIYNGDNRDGSTVQRDAGLERLARKNGVEVVRVSGDWLRIMDKMSGGRPHNGYIMEASPLPRQPIISLGELITTDGMTGFQVNLDHQSREEAAVNGTDDFIKYSSNIPGRKPLVLLLDSIVDPGNLGGIIRTASFLGVTAIAVSTRNSASFTSVVLKASAGASENVTIFSVNKPAGFLVDSKAAGWRVYAAVAPSGRQDPGVPETLTTEQLDDPLSEYPCILMLGGEGEGLRWNLRSKADVDLSIRGSGRSHNVDSLNVSVAAGILCSSFLSKSKVKGISDPIEEVAKVGEQNQPPMGDLF